MIKEYWLYLETYVFIWSDYREIVLFDSLSGKGYVYSNNLKLQPLITKLEDKSNLYCITINEIELACSEIRDFVTSIRETFCGDLIDKSIYRQKPLVIIPDLNVNEEVFTGMKTIKRDLSAGIHAEKNLLELTIYLTGKCTLDCNDCENMYKQIRWCTKNKHDLPKERLFDILNQTSHTSVSKLVFIGGNIFSYPFWDELLRELKRFSFQKSIYINYQILPSIIKQLDVFDSNEFNICLLIDVSNNFEQIVNKVIPINKKYSYIFKVRSIIEFEMVQSIIDQHQIESKVFPYYDSSNRQFFEEYVFQSLDNIMNTNWKKNEVFAHTVLNTNYFGNFTISSNGKIFSNVNYKQIGDIQSDNIKMLVYQELKNGNAWLLTRNKVNPCKKCLYKYLCPPLSNYEIVLGKNNLCNIKPLSDDK